MKAVNLKTEYLKNPIGIDITKPLLFWNCEGGTKQTAYKIIANDDCGNLIWDSGKVNSDKMTSVPFGVSVKSKTKIFWTVLLWDENGNEGERSETATFETAFLSKNEWKAKWISGNYKVKRSERYPVDCFKKEFAAEKEIKKARLYITACGLYAVSINSSVNLAMPLAPGITDYKKRVQYQTYDVTEYIKNGKNEITAELADGWYRGSTGAWGLRNQYGTQTKLIAQLEITYADGTGKTVVTDDSWTWSNDGKIIFADNKDGEFFDANQTPSYSKKAIITSHNVVPTCSNNVPIAEKETFKPTMIVLSNGKKLLDFGQNFAGYISFNITAKKGQKIKITCGEMLDENGNVTLKNIQLQMKDKITPRQKIEYTCKNGENNYKSKFCIFGFRYAEVETDIDISADNFTGIAVYSDMDETGFIETSNELLNKFVEITKWSTKSNHTDLPTDCPTRERHGWTGDAQIFAESAAYLFDYAAFSRKYIRDVYDWQRKDGCLPQIVPYGGVDFYMYTMNGSVGWADAGVLIPYRMYKIYGNKDILVSYYDRMKKYARFMIKRCGKFTPIAKPLNFKSQYKKYLVNCGQSYGEWAEPTDVHPNKWYDMILTHPEVSTAYTSFVMGIMEEIAEITGNDADAKLYNEYKIGCKKAYEDLVKTDKYSLDTDRQASLVRPLYMNLLSDEQKEYAQKRLIKALDNYGWRLGTGFLSTPLILDVLSEIDIQYAYRLLENEEMPGWLFMPKMGATTVWESWEGTEAQGGIASLNHYSKGAVCEWLFKGMCGIKINGENSFVIAPKPGGSLSFASAEYNSIFGKVISSWKKENGEYVYKITVPENCTAEISLPNREKITVNSGKYTFGKD